MRALVSLLIASLCACTEPTVDGPQTCSIEQRRVIPIVERTAIDLLIAIDRSPSMADQADTLRANLSAFAAVLASTEGGLPDLHLAVISTDLGGAGVPGCTTRGDAGAFVDATHCGIDGAFLRNDSKGTDNHAGDFATALACLAEPPLSSCPVSQPLAAIVAALDGSVPRNDRFRRPYAHLALVVISDSDDCSLVDPDALAGVTGEPAVDYTCHTLGAALADVDGTLRHLRATVDEPLQLVLGTITGGPDVRVGPGPRLEPVCDADGDVGPAPRLHHALLPDRTAHVDMCAENWADVFEPLPVGSSLGIPSPCFELAIDRAPDVPGLQSDCVATLVLDGEPFAQVASCADPSLAPDAPCLRFAVDEQRCLGDTMRAVLDYTPRSLPLGTTLEVRCAATCG